MSLETETEKKETSTRKGQEKSIKFDNVKPQVNKVCLKEFTQIYVSITE